MGAETILAVSAVFPEAPGRPARPVVGVGRSTRSPEPTWPEGLGRFADKRYGETTIWFAEPT